ncbi:unnamed protein product [Gordionus sp. m RMFG-2023]
MNVADNQNTRTATSIPSQKPSAVTQINATYQSISAISKSVNDMTSSYIMQAEKLVYKNDIGRPGQFRNSSNYMLDLKLDIPRDKDPKIILYKIYQFLYNTTNFTDINTIWLRKNTVGNNSDNFFESNNYEPNDTRGVRDDAVNRNDIGGTIQDPLKRYNTTSNKELSFFKNHEIDVKSFRPSLS